MGTHTRTNASRRKRLGSVLQTSAAASLLSVGGGTGAWAQADHLPEIEVRGPRDAAIGTADSASEGAVERASLQARPKLRPGDVIEVVPGVVATQHSGDGKANQYFLRGFNLDHGTDFSMWVGGMPVNMPTHGHGQGYSDLNFLIPELVSGVRYRKGPYFVENGDFSLAGSASMNYLSALDAPFAELTLGGHDYRRLLTAGSHTAGDQTWMAALELVGNDGPWDVPENLKKANAVVRYSQGSQARGFNITGMAYKSDWTATDQVPQRLIDSGELGRYGSLNATDGGQSRRLSLSGQWFDNSPAGQTKINAYAIDYRFDLFSDFTYFLNNPDLGDQFEQVDRRHVFGAQASHSMPNKLAGLDGIASFGAQWRGDRIGSVGLYNTQARERYQTVRDDKVSQDAVSIYGQQLVNFNDRWRGYVGLRGDALYYDVQGRESVYGPANSGSGHDAILTPKAGLAFTLDRANELYLNAGTGYHSNDVRGVTISVDPQTGLPADRVPSLVKGLGAEVGWRLQPSEKFSLTTALWMLDLDSELVYVGDAGTTEPGRPSERRGIETTMRWSPSSQWRFELDAALSRARFRGAAPEGDGNYIDNAIETAVSAGVVWTRGPLTATLRMRYMGPRPLDTLNTVRSSSTTLLNLGTRYTVNRNLSLGLDVFNLAGSKGNDIEYYYASCTAREVAGGACAGGIDDRHIHPLEPRTVRVSARWTF